MVLPFGQAQDLLEILRGTLEALELKMPDENLHCDILLLYRRIV